jgi:hypothetical protein
VSLFLTAEGTSDEVKRRLELCTIAQGAETDLGTTVYRGRRVISDDMIPCAVILEGPDRVLEQQGLRVDLEQQYLLYAYVPCDPRNPNVAAHKALRDIKRAIFVTDGKPDWNWGRRVKNVKYEGKDIGPRTDGAAFVLVIVDIAVEFVETLATP